MPLSPAQRNTVARQHTQHELQRAQKAVDWSQQVKQGQTLKAIAQQAGVTPTAVSQTLTWADREGYLQEAEDYVLGQIVPKALQAVEAAVVDGNTKVAVQVLQGAGVLKNVRSTVDKSVAKKSLQEFLEERAQQKALVGEVVQTAEDPPDE